MWLARALPDLQHCLGAGAEPRGARGSLDLSVQWFPDAQLARLEDSCVVAWVRGARPPVNVHHGSPLGAGLLRAWSKDRERDLLERCRLGGGNEAEWSGKWGGWRLADGWRANRDELRFSLWLSRVAWRGGRRLEALEAPFGVARRGWLAFAHPRVSSAFHLSPQVDVAGDGVRLVSALARRDGAVAPGLVLERSFSIDGEGLLVRERLLASKEARLGDSTSPSYRIPGAATEVEHAAGWLSYRLA
jgi:hypothetical protein